MMIRRLRQLLLIVSALVLTLSLVLWAASVNGPFVIGYERDVPYTGPDAATRPQTLDRREDYLVLRDGRVTWERNVYPSWQGDRSRPDMVGPEARGMFFDTRWLDSSRDLWNEWHDNAGTVRARVVAGVGVRFSTATRGWHTLILIPFYLTALLAGAPLMLWGGSCWRTRRRIERNQCTRCGYARKGLAHAAPCPECGVVPTAAITSPPPAAALAAAPRSRP